MSRDEIMAKIQLCEREIALCVAYQQAGHEDAADAAWGEMDWRIGLHDWTEELQRLRNQAK